MITEPANRGRCHHPAVADRIDPLAARSKTTVAERAGYLDRAAATTPSSAVVELLLLEALRQTTDFPGGPVFEHPTAAMADREPRPSPMSVDPYRTVADDNPAIRGLRPKDRPAQLGLPDSPSTHSPNDRIELASIANGSMMRTDRYGTARFAPTKATWALVERSALATKAPAGRLQQATSIRIGRSRLAI